jgi:quercetin dioxygenase-like cupin family protein
VALYVPRDQLTSTEVKTPQSDGGNLGADLSLVFGPGASFFKATRPPGYHSQPHIHDREQFNYAIEGECWLFVGDNAYLMKPGDFSRVPANAVHWAWNRSAEPCTWVEVHIPGNQGAWQFGSNAVPLFDSGETPEEWQQSPPTIFVDAEHYGCAKTEQLSDPK